jgi:integrase
MFLFKRNGIYYVHYIDEFQNRIRRISTKQTKKPDALVFLSELKERLKDKPKFEFITLSNFHVKYLQYVKDNHSANYAKTVNVSFKQLMLSIGDTPIKNISYTQIDKFLTETFKRTKEGARTYHIALKSAFNTAIKWNYLSVNYFAKIKLCKIPKNNPIFIKESEFTELLNLEKNNLLKEVYQFGFYTGMRLSEIINLKWSDVDLTDDIIRVKNTEDFTTKSKKERIIPINPNLKEILINKFPKIISIERNNYLFTKNNIKLNGDYLTKGFKKCIRLSELNPDLHFHDLRHSFASNMAVKGVSIFIIKELLGHQDVKTTQIYSHLRTEDLRASINLLNN